MEDNSNVELVTYNLTSSDHENKLLYQSEQNLSLNMNEEMLKCNNCEEFNSNLFANVLVKNFKDGQDIRLIREKKKIFTDSLFKASNESIVNLNAPRPFHDPNSFYESFKSLKSNIKWKRCKEIASYNPDGLGLANEFVLNENGRPLSKNFTLDEYLSSFAVHDIFQGKIGDCFMISIIMGLIKNKELLAHVVPVDNAKISNMNIGAYHFRFWSLGEWHDVVIDDYLPMYEQKLYFTRNLTYSNEFWIPLFEKAMAKFVGNYENLDGGFPANAFVAISGGIHDTYYTIHAKLKSNHLNIDKNVRNYAKLTYLFENDVKTNYIPNVDELFLILKYAIESLNIIGCSFLSIEKLKKYGICPSHAYNVGMVNQKGQLKYVKIQNPHNKADKIKTFDKNIQFVKILSQHGVDTQTHPGEFFMSYEDFIDCFENIFVTNLLPEKKPNQNLDSLEQLKLKSSLFTQWKVEQFKGRLTNKNSQNKKLQVEISLTRKLIFLITCTQSYKRLAPNVTIDIFKSNNNQVYESRLQLTDAEMQPVFKMNLEPGKYTCSFSYANQQQEEEPFCMRIFYDINE